MFGRVTWLLAGAMTVACLVLVGPSAPSDALFGRPLPAGAARDVVPNRVMTWNICNPCEVSDVDRAAEIAALAPQVIGLQEACVRDVERIRGICEGSTGWSTTSSTGRFCGTGTVAGECRGIREASVRRSSRPRR